MSSLVLYAHPTMADWEYGYVAGIIGMARAEGLAAPEIIVAGEQTAPVATLGGLLVTPQVRVGELDPAVIRLLLLPGGKDWDEPHDQVLRLAGQVLAAGGTVAGICGAVPAMARAGLLDRGPHTGNHPAEFEGIDYPGRPLYAEGAGAVRSGQVITAAGSHAVEFSREVFGAIELFPETEIEAWSQEFGGR